MGEKTAIKRQVISGLVWKFGERITAQLISVIVSIILARLLTPEDYGTVAIIMIFITIANVFVSNGLGNALVQKKDIDDLDFSSVYYLNLLLSLILYGMLFFLAPQIAKFYDMPVLTTALRVLAIRIPVAAINSVQQGYVSRNMLFKRFFWSTLFGTLLSGVVGIVMAYNGFGIWALVTQYLINTCIDTVVLWFTIRWRPIFKCSWKRAKELFSFGWKILVSGLLDTGYRQLRGLIIGKIYTSADLAYYNQGEKYPNLVVININSSISSVLFPALSRYQDDKNKLKAMTRKAIEVSSYIMWPMMIGLGIVAEAFVKVVLTEKWLPCVPFIRIFCFSYALYPIHTANLQAINAVGRSDLFLKLEIVKKAIGLMTILLTVRYGTHAMAYGVVVTDLASTFINASPNKKLLGYGYLEQIRDLMPGFFMALLMALFVYPVKFIGLSDFVTLLVQISLGISVYLVISKMSKNKTFTYLMNTVKHKKS